MAGTSHAPGVGRRAGKVPRRNKCNILPETIVVEQSLGVRHLDKCGHGGCKCLVDPGVSYCSEKCEQADIKAEKNPSEQAVACSCGDPECR